MSKRLIEAVESVAKKPTLRDNEPEYSDNGPKGLVGFLSLIKNLPDQPNTTIGGAAGALAKIDAENRVAAQEAPPKSPYKLRKVLSGHKGWVNTIAVDPDNQWFATGSNDSTIKIWDLVTGKGKMTLTGHTMPIQALAISDRMPYMFSAGLDRSTKCWDLEKNSVIREFHGHSTGVTALNLHPVLNLVATGCRDGTVHIWDIRSRQQVFKMKGHKSFISSIKCRSLDPQIISGSGDSTARFWDLRTGHAVHALTSHQFGIGAIEVAANDTVVTASKESISRWMLPHGDGLETRVNDNYVHSMALSPTQVLALTKANGNVEFSNYPASLTPYQVSKPPLAPGALDSETPVLACAFDKSGCRLITGHSDKTVRIWFEL